MLRAVLAALMLLSAAASLAQQHVIPPPSVAEPAPLPPRGGIAVTADGRMAMSPGVCGALASLDAAVPGADYVPGVDARGNAVAPADVPSSAPPPGLDNFPIEIGVDLKKRFGVSAASHFFRGKAIVGLVTIRDGDAYFNGAKLTHNERAMLTAACGEMKH